MNILKSLGRNKRRAKAKVWEVRQTIWPYEDGWGTYCPETHTVMDTGLSKEEAQRRCDELNNMEKEMRKNDA